MADLRLVHPIKKIKNNQIISIVRNRDHYKWAPAIAYMNTCTDTCT